MNACVSRRRIFTATIAIICAILTTARPVLAQGDAWVTKTPMPTPRSSLIVAAIGGSLYAVGGGKPAALDTIYPTVEAYDPKTDTWSTRASLPTPCWGAGAGVVNGILYVVGCGPSTYAYDPISNTWTAKAALPTPRSGLTVAAVGGTLYAIGGVKIEFINKAYNTVEAYDPTTNSWSAKAPMPTARYFACSGVVNGAIYVAGGEKVLGPSVSETLGTLEAYDPATNSWSTKAPMPVPVRGAACGVIVGKLYVAGGSLGDNVDSLQNLVQVYDPETDTWQIGPPIPTPRFFAGAAVIDDTIYVVGGYPALSVNEAFSPFETVKIDIKPGDPNNIINLKSGGVVEVAILGSATFDPKTVEPSTVTFAGASVATRGNGQPMTAMADVNHDGYPDLILYFRAQDLQLPPSDTKAVLYGKTYSGQPIRGSDSVKIISPSKPAAALRGQARVAILR